MLNDGLAINIVHAAGTDSMESVTHDSVSNDTEALTDSLPEKRERAEALIRRLDPSFRQRWELYDSILKRLTGPGARWLDAGCGSNIAIDEFPTDMNVGIDIHRHPDLDFRPPNHFILGSLEKLPFRDGAFTLVSMNMVVEHLPDPHAVFAEIHRVLAPDGHVLVHTTNIHSPLVFLGTLVPEKIRHRLFTGVLDAHEKDVFRTYHRINTLGAFRRLKGFEAETVHAVQDLNWTNRLVFLCLLVYHQFTRLPGIWRLRTNLIVLLRKKTY